VKLLFTGGGGAGSEALHRLLDGRYETHFADADPDAKPCSIPSRRWHGIPMASDSAYLDTLRELCRELGVDVLVPGVDEELLPLAATRDTLGCAVLLPPFAFVRTHLDKLTSFERLRALGVPAPATARLDEPRRMPFPCIVKPRRGRGSRQVMLARSEEDLRAHVLLSRRDPEDFIQQELLRGQEYTVMMVADRSGTLRAVVPVRVHLKRGITLRAQTDRDPQVEAACAAIHAADPVSGCFNIQVIKTETGEVKPFEINPRVSTTTCLAVAAGVDFVAMSLAGSGDSPAPGLAPFRDGYRLKRSWNNEFIAP